MAQKEVVVITGGNGMIAQRLKNKLSDFYEIRFLSRKENLAENIYKWDVANNYINEKVFESVSHIIHLAGANLGEKRWTKARKQEILDSRIATANLIFSKIQQMNFKLKSYISASAVGFYGTKTVEKIFQENDNPGDDFVSYVVQAWEASAQQFLNHGLAEKVVMLRTGVVLSNEGGALMKMKTPIDFYFGAALGSGQQYMPWIHIDDIVGIYEDAVRHPQIQGVMNAVSPQHVTNEEFTKALAKQLGKPLILPKVPSFVLKMLLGEMANLLLEGSRVDAQKVQQAGYKFKFPDLKSALANLLPKG